MLEARSVVLAKSRVKLAHIYKSQSARDVPLLCTRAAEVLHLAERDVAGSLLLGRAP